jgi:hypothetical protein
MASGLDQFQTDALPILWVALADTIPGDTLKVRLVTVLHGMADRSHGRTDPHIPRTSPESKR